MNPWHHIISSCFLAAACVNSARAGEYSDLIAEDQPVVWLRFDGDANDATGNGHHGEPVNGVKFEEGLPGTGGKAARFDGVDSHVEIEARQGLRQNTIWMECWFLKGDMDEVAIDDKDMRLTDVFGHHDIARKLTGKG